MLPTLPTDTPFLGKDCRESILTAARRRGDHATRLGVSAEPRGRERALAHPLPSECGLQVDEETLQGGAAFTPQRT